MDNIWERIQNLPNLQYAISKGESDAIQELKELYKLALGKTMKRECSSCRIRAYAELTTLTQERISIMKNQKYTFKDDNPVLFEHNHYTNANITDEVAIAMVKASKANAELFNGSFEDLDEKPKAKKKEIEIPANTVIDPKSE